MKKISNILLISGLIVLLAGAIMSLMGHAPYSDYVLIAGAVLVILRGAFRAHEKDETKDA